MPYQMIKLKYYLEQSVVMKKTEFMYYLYLFPFQIDDDNEKIIKRIDNIKDHTHILLYTKIMSVMAK